MAEHPILIMLPSYNEAENIGRLYREIRALGLPADILFIDDNSPDGTGRIIDEIRSGDPNVHALHRPGKMGIGSAHYDGIAWAYDHGYRTLVTMDCDFAHSADNIPVFLERGRHCNIVVGSRFLEARSLAGWNWLRKLLTHLGHFATSRLLGLPYDATGAFRVYDLDVVPRAAFDLIKSKGYSFFFESLLIMHLNGITVGEVPIVLPTRTYGVSKMAWRDVRQSLQRLFEVWQRLVFEKDEMLLAGGGHGADSHATRQAWDHYWGRSSSDDRTVYGIIASVYRNVIIRPALNHFAGRFFPRGAKVLHAGCGAGAVDRDLVSRVRMTALDISPVALERYRGLHGDSCRLLEGSIFAVPAEDGSYAGIYNLGVMEHFREPETRQILAEFGRLLRPGGYALLFWPPTFGLSVKVLHLVHYVANTLLGRNIKLHPDEPGLIRSRE
ncbi:MAG: glycosyltransferase, partial [Magnetospirillum sp.]|nr:glycosyltransferase [Magnetospirillum sp.]